MVFTNFKKILLITLGMVIIFTIMARNTPNAPDNMGGSGFAIIGIAITIAVLGWIAGMIFIRGNIITKFSFSIVTVAVTFVAIFVLFLIAGVIGNNIYRNYCKGCLQPANEDRGSYNATGQSNTNNIQYNLNLK